MRNAPLVLLLAACVSPLASLREARSLRVASTDIALRYSEADRETQFKVARALEAAMPALERWGGLAEPVTLSVLPSHEALERAVGRHAPWLRAWGRYDEIWLQSPRTWPSPPRDADIAEWLTHELTHCLLFQRSSAPQSWESQRLPLWFREGMATVTARQGYRYASLEDLAAWQLANPNADIFTDGEALALAAQPQVYGLSHHAMSFLLRRYGDNAVLETMERLQSGEGFELAFANAVGISPAAFAREFGNYLRLRGFRGLGLPVLRSP